MDDFATLSDPNTAVFVRLLPGPIERVWAYLTESDKRAEWFTSGALPQKVGEPFEMQFKHSTYSPNKAPPPKGYEEMDAKGHTSRNTLLALEPPHRLAFTFGEEKGRTSEVEFRLEAVGDKVRLTLTHSKIPDRKYAIGVSGGWHAHLAILQYRAEGKVPPAFWDLWRETEGVYEKRYA